MKTLIITLIIAVVSLISLGSFITIQWQKYHPVELEIYLYDDIYYLDVTNRILRNESDIDKSRIFKTDEEMKEFISDVTSDDARFCK